MHNQVINKITKTRYGYNVYINDFKINLEEKTFFNYRLKRGEEISSKLLEQILNENEIEVIKRKSLTYLSRQRSVLQFKTYLRTLNAAESLINELTNNYKEKGYLNDLEFAELLIERLQIKYGKKKIQQSLVESGIHKDIINSLLENYKNPNIEFIVKDTIKKTKANNYTKAKQKVIRSLISKGFDLSETNIYIDNYLKKDNFNEEEAIKKDYFKIYLRYKDKFEGAMLKNKIKTLLYQRGYSKESIENIIRSEFDV